MFSIGDLGQLFTSVGVVKAIPSVVISKHSSYLGLVKERSFGSVSWFSLDLVVCVLRSLGKVRNEVVSPISHSRCRAGETVNVVEGIEGDCTLSPLLESKLIA